MAEIQNFSRQTLTNYDFSNEDLTGANFYRTVLQNCNFSGANLSNTKFKKTLMFNCNFTNANFTNAIFFQCQTSMVNFTRANLTNANLDNANLNGTNFSEAIFTNTKFTSKTIMTHTEITNAIMENMILGGADFSNAKIKDTNIKGCDFSLCKCWRTHFIHVDATNAIFSESRMNECTISNSIFNNAIINSVNFYRTYVTYSQFTGANLSDTNMSEGRFTNSNFNNANLNNVNLNDAILDNSTFINSNFVRAKMNRTRMTNADWTGAILTRVILTRIINPPPHARIPQVEDIQPQTLPVAAVRPNNPFLQVRPVAQVQAVAQVRPVAQVQAVNPHEVHQAMVKTLNNLPEIFQLMNPYNEAVPQLNTSELINKKIDSMLNNLRPTLNYDAAFLVSLKNKTQIVQNVISGFGNFINSTIGKAYKDYQKNILYPTIKIYEILSNSLFFVSKLTLDTQIYYFDDWGTGCLTAYDGTIQNPMSCAKGIIERFLFSIASALQTYLDENIQNFSSVGKRKREKNQIITQTTIKDNYIKLISLILNKEYNPSADAVHYLDETKFTTLFLTRCFQTWYNEHTYSELTDELNDNQQTKTTEIEKFKECVKQKYDAYDEKLPETLNYDKLVNNYIETVLKTTQGGRRNKKTKKIRNQKNIRKHKKTYKNTYF